MNQLISVFFSIFQRIVKTNVKCISLNKEAESFPKDSLIRWRANRKDLIIMSKNFRYNMRDTQKYCEAIEMIPRYIPKSEMLSFKNPNCKCSYNVLELKNIVSHESFMCPMISETVKCHLCPNSTTLMFPELLGDHYENHLSDEIYICGRCSKFFSNEAQLKTHMSLHKTDVVGLEVIRSEDKIAIKYRIYLRSEVRTLLRFKKCILCDYVCREVQLEDHLMDCHFFKLYYSCWHCKSVESWELQELLPHFRNKHNGNVWIQILLKLRFDKDENVSEAIETEKTPDKLEIVEDDHTITREYLLNYSTKKKRKNIKNKNTVSRRQFFCLDKDYK